MTANRTDQLLRTLDDADLRREYSADRFGLTVLSSRFDYIIDHVCSKLLTNAFSPIIRDFNDFSATLAAGPRLDYITPAVAVSLPVFIGSMRDAVANSLEEFGTEDLCPGDVIVGNDPYRAGTHVNDVCFMRPVIVAGELVSVLTIRAHMMDIGGTVPGGLSGMKRNVYENGLVLPPMRLYRDDKPVRSTFSLILDNARWGNLLLPDIQSIYRCLRLGEDLIRETIDRYGVEAFEGAMRYKCDVSAESTREALRALPNGVYEGYDDIDCDGVSDDVGYRVQVTINKRGAKAEVDFSGTSHQARTSINCAWPDVKTGVSLALKYLLDPTTSYTSAALRDVDIVLPSGTIASAEPPDGPVMLYHEPLASCFAAIVRAMSKALGPRALAGDTRPYLHDAVGTSRSGNPFVTTMSPTGGWGANAAGDADSGQLGYWTNYIDPPVESVESVAPVFVMRKEYLVDSGGAGQHRGGAGLVKDSYWPVPVEHHICVPKVKTPNGLGVQGGKAGGAGGVWLWENHELTGASSRVGLDREVYRKSTPITGMVDPDSQAPDLAGTYVHWGARAAFNAEATTFMRFISCGGGGWGDPFSRSPAAVVRDVRDGYLTIAGALEQYGVVVTGDPETNPENLDHDDDATHEARSVIRQPRRDGAGLEPVLAPALVVEREPAEGSCAACGKSELAQYPVLAEDGWQLVVKCQSCLADVSREPWNRLGAIDLLEDVLEI